MVAEDPDECLELFVVACDQPGCVVAWPEAVRSAREDFGLYPHTEMFEFVANRGLEVPCHISREPLRHNAVPENPIMVDAYNFRSGQKFGYLAIYRGPTAKWVIKSFKKNDKIDDRNLPFLNLAKVLGGKK